eukprot:gene5813-11720_t
MDFILSPNEDVLFKHQSICNKSEGTLYVTNLRIAWVPTNSESQETIVVSFGDISKDQYSPLTDPRVMVRITRISSNSPLVFILAGSDPNLCRKELENLKIIMKKIRSNESIPSQSKTPEIPMTDRTNKKIKLSNNKTQNVINNNEEEMYRKNVLNTNKELKKDYIDLVIESKVIDEEEFWNSRKHILSEKEALECSKRKGFLSTLFSDTQAIDRDGKLLVQTVTPEIIHHIFEMYPAVRRAYDAKVPTELSETEFWTKYYQSEYFSRDKGVKTNYSSHSQHQHHNGGGGGDVDITANYGDYYNLKEKEFSDNLPTAHAVVEKYNRNSQIVMQKQNLKSGTNTSSITMNQNEQSAMSELLSEKPSNYISLNLNLSTIHKSSNTTDTTDTGTSSGTGTGSGSGIAVDVDVAVAMGSSGGSSSSSSQLATVNGITHCQLSKDINGMKQQQKQKQKQQSMESVEDIMNSLDRCIPSPSRASALLGSITKDIRDTQTQTQTEVTQNTDTGAGVGGRVVPVPMLIDLTQNVRTTSTDIGLPDDFKQRMLERFSGITELLRHFYTILSRDGAQAPSPNSDAAVKVVRILVKLDEHLQWLGQYRKDIQEKSRIDKSTSTTSMLRLIKQLSDLIHRAVDKWDKYNEKFGHGHHSSGSNSSNGYIATTATASATTGGSAFLSGFSSVA